MNKIHTCINYKVTDLPSLLNLENIIEPIGLAIFHYEVYDVLRYDLEKFFKDYNKQIKVFHLPINFLKFQHKDLIGDLLFLNELIGVKKFVIHPNKGILEFIEKFIQEQKYHQKDFTLCIENFQWKRGKILRGPLHIQEMCRKYPKSLRMTFDTSHAEKIWFDPKIFSYFKEFISVIHLSNRSGNKQHLPFNTNGELNLIGFVRQLRHHYNWSGDIVLEYMDEFNYQLSKNLSYLDRLIE